MSRHPESQRLFSLFPLERGVLVGLAAFACVAAPGLAQNSAPRQRSEPTNAANAIATQPDSPKLEAPVAVLARAARGLHDHMLYDAPGDGSLWARGATYKASFDDAGATYFPAFGKRAAHDLPHSLSPDAVTIGGDALAFDPARAAVRDHDQVLIDRGSFVESYELAPNSLEQSFVFRSLPARGELVVHLPIASELAASATDDGIEFRGEFGGVRCSHAVAIDAKGRRVDAALQLDAGAITIRVDAAFVAQAELPLTLDPFVSTIFFPGAAGADDFAADVAYDPALDGWLVVWEETFSATDTDVYSEFHGSTGALLASANIDFTTAAWSRPRCANLAAAQQFLVVAGVAVGSVHTVMGRTVTPALPALVLGSQFTISGAEVGDKLSPDVGGDPFGALPSNYCVAYEHDVSANTSEIVVRTVTSASALGAQVFLASVAGSRDVAPSVSKSDDTREWIVAWERASTFLPIVGQVWAAHVHWDGTLFDGPFQISSVLSHAEFNVHASSPIRGSTRSMIVFQRSNTNDIFAAAIEGTTVVQQSDLSSLEGLDPSLVRVQPNIDCDGQHFLVTYSENLANGTSPDDVYATDLFLDATQIGVTQSHVLLHHFGLGEVRSSVSAEHFDLGLHRRYMVVYDFEQNPTDHDIAGALFDTLEGGTASSFCAGDGSSGLCPCVNIGISGHGCPNASNLSGALLTLSGTPSTLDDTVVLHASNMPPTATCIFLQGSTSVSAVNFGDGLRCVGGTLIRLGVEISVGGNAVYPGPSDASVTVRGGIGPIGGLRGYQTWYRDPGAFCTSSTFNISNGVLVDWAP